MLQIADSATKGGEEGNRKQNTRSFLPGHEGGDVVASVQQHVRNAIFALHNNAFAVFTQLACAHEEDASSSGQLHSCSRSIRLTRFCKRLKSQGRLSFPSLSNILIGSQCKFLEELWEVQLSRTLGGESKGPRLYFRTIAASIHLRKADD